MMKMRSGKQWRDGLVCGMAAVSDELVPIPSKRVKLDPMEHSGEDEVCRESPDVRLKEEASDASPGGGCQRLTQPAEDSSPGDADDDDEEDEDDDEDDEDEDEEREENMERGKRRLAAKMLVERALMAGTDPRALFCRITGENVSFMSNVPDSIVWKLVISYLMDEAMGPKRKRLKNVCSLSDVVRLIKSSSRILVLTGAGVSVSCGIPDFRSRDGVYARLAQDFPDLPNPQAIFDIDYFSRNPSPFFKFAKEIFPGQFTPSPGHRFIKTLEKHGKLLRNYTQNIDTLEKQAGISNVIECHGSFATASCTKCGHRVEGEMIREEIVECRVPYCKAPPSANGEEAPSSGGDAETETEDSTQCRGVIKPDIVFFGEGLPSTFHDSLAADKEMADLLIVMGSSLKVKPVALIPNSLPSKVPQILINRERLSDMNFDVELLGDCDVIVDELCRLLGEGWEEVQWRPKPLTPLPDYYVCRPNRSATSRASTASSPGSESTESSSTSSSSSSSAEEDPDEVASSKGEEENQLVPDPPQSPEKVEEEVVEERKKDRQQRSKHKKQRKRRGSDKEEVGAEDSSLACRSVPAQMTLDTSRDSGIGEASNLSPPQEQVSAQPTASKPTTHPSSDKKDEVGPVANPAQLPSIVEISAGASFCRITRRRYVFPGVEVCQRLFPTP